MPCSCQLTKARAVCLHQMCSVSRCFRSLLLLLSRYCRSCVEKPLPLVSKTAVPFRRLLRVVLADGVLGVLQAEAVVWCRTAVVPGVGSVRSSVAAVHSQETPVGGAVVAFVHPSRWQAVDVNAAVEAVVYSPLPRFVVPRCGRWSASGLHSLGPLLLQVQRQGSVFGDQFVMSYLGPFTIITKLFQQECQARTFPSDCF